MKHTYYVSLGHLCHYYTGQILRNATKAEDAASLAAARHDGGAGVIGDEDLSRPIGRRTLDRIARALGAS